MMMNHSSDRKEPGILLFKLKEIMHITKGMINRLQDSINTPSQLGYSANYYATSIYQIVFTERKGKLNYVFKTKREKVIPF